MANSFRLVGMVYFHKTRELIEKLDLDHSTWLILGYKIHRAMSFTQSIPVTRRFQDKTLVPCAAVVGGVNAERIISQSHA